MTDEEMTMNELLEYGMEICGITYYPYSLVNPDKDDWLNGWRLPSVERRVRNR